MVALTKDRNTPARSGDISQPGVDGGSEIFAGSLVAINAAGFAVPMATAATLIGMGRAEEHVDNTAGADGDVTVKVGRGIYRFANSAAADAITLADIGDNCFGVDDQTVAKTDGTGTRSVAGKIHDVDAAGVWVKFS